MGPSPQQRTSASSWQRPRPAEEPPNQLIAVPHRWCGNQPRYKGSGYSGRGSYHRQGPDAQVFRRSSASGCALLRWLVRVSQFTRLNSVCQQCAKREGGPLIGKFLCNRIVEGSNSAFSLSATVRDTEGEAEKSKLKCESEKKKSDLYAPKAKVTRSNRVGCANPFSSSSRIAGALPSAECAWTRCRWNGQTKYRSHLSGT